ncbi:MAG: 3-hydroxyacyl-CoA dehydrogenase [Desulfobacterales bacterium]|nr:3-hydroxyacyl-CoA dehydrogenase [Desulfobacterales bacterium]
MQVNDIKRVLIIGAGTMGHQIGFVCAASGYEVTVYDVFPKMLAKAQKRMTYLAKRLTGRGMIKPGKVNAALKRMNFTDDPKEAGSNADLVSESIPEDPKLKGKVFGRFDQICPQKAIFTTNTSSLLPSMFAEATGRPERFLALHFHDVALTKIVDVMPHEKTKTEIVEITADFAKKIGQIPIVLQNEQSGYLFNNMLMALLDSSLTLASRRIAPICEIDRSWMGIMHSPTGPFGIMDSIGLDTVLKVTSYWAKQRNDEKARKNAAFVKSYVDKNRLGVKSGQGFYSYPDPDFSHPNFVTGKTTQ